MLVAMEEENAGCGGDDGGMEEEDGGGGMEEDGCRDGVMEEEDAGGDGDMEEGSVKEECEEEKVEDTTSLEYNVKDAIRSYGFDPYTTKALAALP